MHKAIYLCVSYIYIHVYIGIVCVLGNIYGNGKCELHPGETERVPEGREPTDAEGAVL